MRKPFKDKEYFRDLTYHPRTASFLLPTGPRLVCIPDSQSTFDIRAAYSFFSLAYGQRICSLCALHASENPYTIDAASFLTLILLSYSTCGPRPTWPTILRTMLKDSALYFLAVLGSHLLVVLYIIIVPVSSEAREEVFRSDTMLSLYRKT